MCWPVLQPCPCCVFARGPHPWSRTRPPAASPLGILLLRLEAMSSCSLRDRAPVSLCHRHNQLSGTTGPRGPLGSPFGPLALPLGTWRPALLLCPHSEFAEHLLRVRKFPGARKCHRQDTSLPWSGAVCLLRPGGRGPALAVGTGLTAPSVGPKGVSLLPVPLQGNT